MDDLERQLELMMENAKSQAAAASSFADGIGSLTATEQTGDGAVRVTVGSSGQLTGLTFSERFFDRKSPAEAAAAVLDCARRAQAKLAQQAQQVVAELPEGDSALAERIVDGFRDRFGEPDPVESPPPRRHDDPDDFSERNFLDQKGRS